MAQAPPATTPSTSTVPAPPTPAPAATPTPAPAPAPAPGRPARLPSVPSPTPAATPAPAPTPAPKPSGPAGQKGYQALELGPDAAFAYDPYTNATALGDPRHSYDGDRKTAFTIASKPADEMAVGLTFDLVKATEVGSVELRTTTPGFRVEVYGAKDELPPDILDSRWKHLAGAAKVGAGKGEDGVEKITFDRAKYRYVLLWLTTPPPAPEGAAAGAAPTVGISEVRILD